MGMELLRCKSPDMAEKELFAYLVAYNLIRCLMAQALTMAKVEMERLSFKGTVDALRQYTMAIASQPNKKSRRMLWHRFIAVIAEDLVPLRPGRNEPRAIKRRPKAYQLLNKPRHIFKEVPHRCRIKKLKTVKNRDLNKAPFRTDTCMKNRFHREIPLNYGRLLPLTG